MSIRGTSGLLATGLVVLLSAGPIPTPSAHAQQQHALAESRAAVIDDAWSARVWATAREKGEGALRGLASDFPTDAVEEPIARLRDSFELFETNLEKRNAERVSRIETVRAEIETALRPTEGAPTDLDLSKAMRLAAEWQMLVGDAGAVVREPVVAELIARAESAAKGAESRADWLMASELFHRLNVLTEEVDGRYLADLDRQNDRLAMIRLYVPEKLWQLRNSRRLMEMDTPLPPYNATADGWSQKLNGISRYLVIRALLKAAQSNVEGVTTASLLDGGLEAIRTLASTECLSEAFPGIADPKARDAMVKFVDQARGELRHGNRVLGVRDITALIESLLSTNQLTLRIPEEALLHEFGNGAMGRLDEYSSIIWPDEVRRFQRNTRGSFVGIGVQIHLDEAQRLAVVTPLEGTPAQRAGIRAGDVISKVDGISTVGFSLDQAVDVITGPRGTKVTLTIEREIDGQTQEIEFVITRDVIDVKSVKGWKRGEREDDWEWFIDREAGIGYVRLTQFQENTTAELERAIVRMRAVGLRGLILDLRFNPGGLLNEAVGVASQFIESGRIVTTEAADGSVAGVETALGGATLADIPIVVLINEGSASASEIVAGAIQDYARTGTIDAIVVGERSFGKGSVQNVWPLPVQTDAMLKLTTQYYKLPAGRLIHRQRHPGETRWGIEPDVTVSMLPSQIEASLLLRQKADLLVLDENGAAKRDDAEPAPDPDDLLAKGIDLQLNTALVLLQSRTLAPIASRTTMKPVGEPASAVR
ncbi:MAG: S41 family peptidase [Leptolyngbya sp. PLA2]|nr:S41 family peptidase [Leptolyngbya sp.]MCE7970703.1 S41 family peptidase [Leptolyngbya sp. PL-A2]MCZ7633426.1 S41 family peptidase [Phycisphaerales bacterium]MDL1903398.1 S41 family peptidase [Synechococcales cyanobacterium CNB]GIK18097.1 MAG: hypothetical protein BroJett004_02610 [Planctomycetota bacterium]